MAALLLAAWACLSAGAAVWAVSLVVAPRDAPHPGFVAVFVLGAVGGLPTAVRLVTGRLHLWRLELDRDGLRDRGGRTDATIAWAVVRSLVLNENGTRLLVEAGLGPVIAVPMLAFDVPAEQLLAAAERVRGGRTG